MPKKRLSPNLKAIIAARAAYLCEYCMCPANYVPVPYDGEHILPTSEGGTDELDNFANSCHGCNVYKSNKIKAIDPVNNVLVPLFHPRNDIWEEHFVWDDSGLLMQGKTPTGRATVEALKLNRVPVVNLRALLVMAGKHPPK